MIKEISDGNIFTSDCQTLVNTVNCVGVMGAGIALEFRLRFPEMYKSYKMRCKNREYNIGKLSIYRPDEKEENPRDERWVLNFPTKRDWKNDSKTEYLERGLEKFVATYKEQGVTSVAFPVLGSRNGKIDEYTALEIMNKHLSQCAIKIEIYKYSPSAKDDLIRYLKKDFENKTDDQILAQKNLNRKLISLVRSELPNVNSIMNFKQIERVGLKSMKRLFDYAYTCKSISEKFKNTEATDEDIRQRIPGL